MAAGMGAQEARLPGGWLLGPMAVAIAAGMLHPRHGQMPSWALKTGQAVIGLMVAGVFRPSVLARVTILDRETAAFGTLPGGARSMIAIACFAAPSARTVWGTDS